MGGSPRWHDVHHTLRLSQEQDGCYKVVGTTAQSRGTLAEYTSAYTRASCEIRRRIQMLRRLTSSPSIRREFCKKQVTRGPTPGAAHFRAKSERDSGWPLGCISLGRCVTRSLSCY